MKKQHAPNPDLAIKGIPTVLGQSDHRYGAGKSRHGHSVAHIMEYYRAQYWDAEMKSWRSVKYRASTETGARALVAAYDFYRVLRIKERRRQGQSSITSSTIVDSWEPPTRVERVEKFLKLCRAKGIDVRSPAVVRVVMHQFGMTHGQALRRLREEPMHKESA